MEKAINVLLIIGISLYISYMLLAVTNEIKRNKVIKSFSNL